MKLQHSTCTVSYEEQLQTRILWAYQTSWEWEYIITKNNSHQHCLPIKNSTIITREKFTRDNFLRDKQFHKTNSKYSSCRPWGQVHLNKTASGCSCTLCIITLPLKYLESFLGWQSTNDNLLILYNCETIDTGFRN